MINAGGQVDPVSIAGTFRGRLSYSTGYDRFIRHYALQSSNTEQATVLMLRPCYTDEQTQFIHRQPTLHSISYFAPGGAFDMCGIVVGNEPPRIGKTGGGLNTDGCAAGD